MSRTKTPIQREYAAIWRDLLCDQCNQRGGYTIASLQNEVDAGTYRLNYWCNTCDEYTNWTFIGELFAIDDKAQRIGGTQVDLFEGQRCPECDRPCATTADADACARADKNRHDADHDFGDDDTVD